MTVNIFVADYDSTRHVRLTTHDSRLTTALEAL